jgi:hypothetical protein
MPRSVFAIKPNSGVAKTRTSDDPFLNRPAPQT